MKLKQLLYETAPSLKETTFLFKKLNKFSFFLVCLTPETFEDATIAGLCHQNLKKKSAYYPVPFVDETRKKKDSRIPTKKISPVKLNFCWESVRTTMMCKDSTQIVYILLQARKKNVEKRKWGFTLCCVPLFSRN